VRDGAMLRPQMARARAGSAAPVARVALPQLASDPFQFVDAASGLSVDVRLDGARPVAAQVARGYVIYPSAHASGAHLLHRPIADGTEDYLAFDTRPAQSEVSYGIALRTGVAGLRLVANTLELLDKSGAPRLRVSPPYIVGADGKSHNATIALAGCAADTNPAAPWGRKITAPGADRCTVKIAWNSDEVTYPALLDPRWSATANSMNAPRAEHSATRLNNGTVLVVGGINPSISVTATADIYDPGSNSFAATASMANARFGHTATLLPNGDVLVVGGQATPGYIQKTERYNGATWLQTDADPPQALTLHTASRIEGGAQVGKVLVVGGTINYPNDSSITQVLLFDPAGAGPGTFSAVASLPIALEAHSQVSEGGGSRVVVAGGFTRTEPGPTDTFQTGSYVYDANNDAAGWTFAGDTGTTRGSSDGGAPMLRLAGSGKVLFMGGNAQNTQLYTFGVVGWAAAGSTNFTHAFGAAAQLANGSVLLTGGDNDNVAELWDPSSLTWTQTDNLLGHRGDHTATAVGATVLLTGGTQFGAGTTNSAELYTTTATGTGCVANGECTTGFCAASGVCCNNACPVLINGTASCATGTCVDTCNAGYTNCDGTLATNGCNVNTAGDPTHCGACGTVCSGVNDTPSCGGGACTSVCNPGFANCNGTLTANGCNVNTNTDPNNCHGCGVVVNTSNDPNNCGACGHSCNDGNACTHDVCNSGVCFNVNLTACANGCDATVACGFADTDGDGLNDTWESHQYIDLNCNGINDVGTDTPLPGANPLKPNVYVKYDYMQTGGHTHQPSTAAINAVIAAYAAHNTILTMYTVSDSLTEHAVVSLSAPGALPQPCSGPRRRQPLHAQGGSLPGLPRARLSLRGVLSLQHL